MMKKLMAVILALVLSAVCCAAALADETAEEQEALKLFDSDWVSVAGHVSAAYMDGYWSVEVTSGDYTVEWDYFCVYDAERKALVSSDEGYGNTKTIISRDLEGSEIGREVEYSDGQAEFTVNENGKLVWKDLKEDAGAGAEFEKIGWFAYDFYSEHCTMNIFWDVDEEEDGTIHAGLKVQIEKAEENSYTSWTYSAAYNAEDNTLVAFLGTKEVQEAAGEALATIYYDGEAVFSWDEEGGLHWDDKVEDAGEGEVFERSNG